MLLPAVCCELVAVLCCVLFGVWRLRCLLLVAVCMLVVVCWLLCVVFCGLLLVVCCASLPAVCCYCLRFAVLVLGVCSVLLRVWYSLVGVVCNSFFPRLFALRCLRRVVWLLFVA